MNNKKLTSALSLGIIIVSLLIVFNLINILENPSKGDYLTGYVTQNQTTEKQGEMYSTESYLVYYSVITFLVSIIIFLAIMFHKMVWKNIEIEESQKLG